MNFFDTVKLLHRLPRFSGNGWAGLLGATVLLVSSAVAQNATKSQSPARQTKTERLKVSAPPLVMEKELFFQKAGLGAVTAIRPAPAWRDSQPFFWVAGERGAALVTGSGAVQHSVVFEHKGGKVTPWDLDGDGTCEFVSCDGRQGDLRVFDGEGRQRWRYGLGLDPAVGDATCGDLDGDGQLECVVGMKKSGGVRLLNRNGKEIWEKPETNVWHVEILDINGDGKNEIVHSNAIGLFRIRNGGGDILRELPYKNVIANFSLCRWPGADGGWFILNNNKATGLQIIDFEGKVITGFPTAAMGYEAGGVPVRLERGEKPLFALLVCDCLPHRDTWLYLYDSEGNLIFQDKLQSRRATLLTVVDETPGQEALLVGEEDGKVWRYRLVPATPGN